MEGVIIYNNYNILGTITQNTEDGIYGTLDRIDALFTDTQPLEAAADESQIEEGEATIRCAVSGQVEDYRIRITKVDRNAQEANKEILLEVTDEQLLELTGGHRPGHERQPHYPERTAHRGSDPRVREQPEGGLRHFCPGYVETYRKVRKQEEGVEIFRLQTLISHFCNPIIFLDSFSRTDRRIMEWERFV